MWEWWTYSPSDFVMYSTGTYLRLVGRHNEAVWPAQIFAIASSVAIVVAAFLPRRRLVRIALVVSSAAWAAVAVSWFFLRFATIQTFARWFGAAFLVEAVLLLWMALRPSGATPTSEKASRLQILAAIAFMAFPLLGLASGRSLNQVELFALMPTPTAIATLAALPAGSTHARVAFLIPIIWLAWDAMSFVSLGMREGVFIAVTGLALASMAAFQRLRIPSRLARRPH